MLRHSVAKSARISYIAVSIGSSPVCLTYTARSREVSPLITIWNPEISSGLTGNWRLPISVILMSVLSSKEVERKVCLKWERTSITLQNTGTASKGFVEAMRRILQEGPDINGRAEKNHLSPLYLAARECHAGAVKLLLEHKAKMRLYSETYGTPLNGALSNWQKMNEDKVYEVVDCLLKADDGKECINFVEVINGAPLMRAASLGYLKCCLLLTRYGASVHATDVNKRGLLHAIASNGWTDFLQQILGAFSLEELEAHDGKGTPREIAKKSGHKQIVHLLDARRRELKRLENNVTGLRSCFQLFTKKLRTTRWSEAGMEQDGNFENGPLSSPVNWIWIARCSVVGILGKLLKMYRRHLILAITGTFIFKQGLVMRKS